MTSVNLSENKDIESIRNYIFSIDFSMIIDKMVLREKWRRSDAEKACEMYRNFLFLNVKYSEHLPLPPSDEIDEFWHHHILDTKKYIKDCEQIFGRYFHHYPYLGKQEANKMFENTQALYHQEFGDYIYKIRRHFIVASLLKWAE